MIHMMRDNDYSFNLLICNKVGDVFSWACKMGYDLKSFAKAFNKSIYNKDDFSYPLSLYDDFSLIGQGCKYIVNVIAKELDIKPDGDNEYDKDVACWMGYIFAMNHFYAKIDIADETIDWMYDNYEVLHMEDVSVTLDRIKEEQS